MPIVLAVVVASNNLVPRVGTIGIQCEYYKNRIYAESDTIQL